MFRCFDCHALLEEEIYGVWLFINLFWLINNSPNYVFSSPCYKEDMKKERVKRFTRVPGFEQLKNENKVDVVDDTFSL